jgi:hypothetical protein
MIPPITKYNMCYPQALTLKCLIGTFTRGGLTDMFIYDHTCRLDGWHAEIPNGQTNDWTTGVGGSMISFYSGKDGAGISMVSRE